MSLLTDLIGSVSGVADPITAPASIVNAAQSIIGMFKVSDTVKAQLQTQLTTENLDMEKTQLATALAMSQAQTTIDDDEAKSGKLIDDWRDAVGWVCAAGLAYGTIIQPFLQFMLATFHFSFINGQITLPTLDSGAIVSLLMAMLGLGTMRTVEKTSGPTDGSTGGK